MDTLTAMFLFGLGFVCGVVACTFINYLVLKFIEEVNGKND